MKKVLSIGLALLLAGCGGAKARTIDEAANAYDQNRVAEAEEALRAIAADAAGAPADKARAYRELARIAWLVDGNEAGARALLRSAHGTGQDGCQNALLLSRVLQEGGGDALLVAQARTLAGRCPEEEDQGQILLRAAAAALELAATAQASALADALPADVAGSLEGATLRLELNLLEGRADEALQAWKDYFWLTDVDLPQGMAGAVPSASAAFAAGLAANASPDARLALVDLLVRAGFARPAERFARAAGLPSSAPAHPLWRKAAAYFEARRELVATVLRSNRAVAKGGSALDLEAAVETMARKLGAAVGQEGSAEVLRRAYGLRGRVGDTEGQASVHYGHVVQGERRAIEQYGHRADVGFLAIDNMLANGFYGWLWDGRAEVGGWTEPDQTIVQVRSGFTSAPLDAWNLAKGGPARDRLIDRREEGMRSDAALLQGDDVAYLPGLADRLRLQVADRIAARARTLAAGADARRAFLQEYWRATFNQSILAHEGRHALDRKLVRGLARLSDAHLEYRAKMSEIALAQYPRLALLNVNEPSIGGDSGHGKANALALRGFAEWIRTHPEAVAGFDPKLPPLAQLDRLSDDQLRAIARGLDILAVKWKAARGRG